MIPETTETNVINYYSEKINSKSNESSKKDEKIKNLLQQWGENAKINNKDSNKEMLSKLIKDETFSEVDLYLFMKGAEIRAEGGWFKEGILWKTPKPLATLFEECRKCKVEEFYAKTEMNFPEVVSIQKLSEFPEPVSIQKPSEFPEPVSIQKTSYSEDFKIEYQLARWQYNSDKSNKDGNSKILIDLITDETVSNSKLFEFMNKSGIRENGGWFTKKPTWFSRETKKERTAIFEKHRGNIQEFFKSEMEKPIIEEKKEKVAEHSKYENIESTKLKEHFGKKEEISQIVVAYQNPEKGVTLLLKQGDILKTSADIIVNAANKDLRFGGGISGQIHKAAGVKDDNNPIMVEKKAWLTVHNKERMDVGSDYVMTSAGELGVNKQILHVAGPDCRINEENLNRVNLLRKAYESCFEGLEKFAAERKQDHVRIAIPVLSGKIFNYDSQDSTLITLSVVNDFIKNRTAASPTYIIELYTYEKEDTENYVKAMQQRGLFLD